MERTITRIDISLETLKFVEKTFDDLWNQADELVKKYNPCGIKKHFFSGNVSCKGCNKTKPYFTGNIYTTQINSLCCGGCKFGLNGNGCTALKPITCRTWFCQSVRLTEDLKMKFYEIIRKNNDYFFVFERGDKFDSILKSLSYFDWNKFTGFNWENDIVVTLMGKPLTRELLQEFIKS